VPNATISDTTRKAYATQKLRQKYDKSYFLLVDSNGDRKFPIKNPETGELDAALLRAAITRAAQYGYNDVEKKAQKLYEENFSAKKDLNLEILEKDSIKGEEVFGIVLMPDTPDAEGDTFTKEAIREACFEFNKDFLNQTYRHQQFLNKEKAAIVESYIAPVEFTLDGKVVKEGTWLMRSRIFDENLKKDVKNGVIKGFSVGGYGE
jgi:hypothetical protein